MKKQTLFKGLCMTVATSLLAAVLPMGAMAADGVKTIAVDFDTYTQRNLTDDYSGSTSICYQDNNNNNYDREAFFGFDLSKLEIPEGKVIDTAEITVYSYSFKNASAGAESTTASADVSMYAMGNVDWTTAGVITWADHYKSDKVKIATTAFAPEGTFTRGDSSVFDVSDYLNGKSSGKEMFVIYPDKVGVTGYIYSMEDSDGKYAATLSVTFEDADSSEPTVPSEPVAVPDPETIKAEYDNFVRDHKDHREETHPTDNAFYSTLLSGNNKYGLIGFDLTKIEKEGFDVDTATLTLSLSGYKRASGNTSIDQGAHEFTAYSIGSADYDATPALTYNMLSGKITARTRLGSTIISPNGSTATKDKYSFDVSEYFNGLTEYRDNQLFMVHPEPLTDEEKALNINTIEASFLTIERNWPSYIPSLTVTYKVAEQKPEEEKNYIVVDVADSRIVTDVASQNATSTNTYGLRNFGNAFKSIAKFAFDIYDIDSLIPEGKVIKSAELSYYVTSKSKNSNSSNNVTAQSIRVMNYDDNYWIDPSVKSAEDSLATWTITDEMTGETYNDDAAEAVRTGYQFSISGENHIYEGLEESVYEGATTVTIDKWFSVDVTEYFISQMNNEDAMGYVSFALTPSQSENGPVHVANGWNPKAPKITLTLADAGEGEALEIGKPVYISGYAEGTEIEQVAAGKRIAIAIPVSGKTETPVNAKIYLAAYNGDELVKISAHDFAFYQGEGNLYYYFNTVEGTTAVKAFIWTGDNVPVVETDVLSVVAAE